jgi:hypothetical protein
MVSSADPILGMERKGGAMPKDDWIETISRGGERKGDATPGDGARILPFPAGRRGREGIYCRLERPAGRPRPGDGPRLHKALDALEVEVLSGRYRREVRPRDGWEGADVVVCREAGPERLAWAGARPAVVSFQADPPRRRLVVTPHAAELGWLLGRLRESFAPRLDPGSKYDFFGALADSALAHGGRSGEGDAAEGLLLCILRRARRMV